MPAAVELNAEGKKLYREGKWEAAREKYRASLAADSEFLAPRLNVACSFVRQEKFADALAEVLALIERGFVPWGRDILEAADLGAFKPRPEMKRIQDALAAAARAWGDGIADDLLFVARIKPPLALPKEGVLVLGLQQEIFAWSPRTGRYRQITNQDGRVLAFARSADRRRVVYATAEKLVRPVGGGPALLRSVALHVLDLPLMARAEPVLVPGDVQRLDIGFRGTDPLVRATGDRVDGVYLLAGGQLVPTRARVGGATVLSAAGAVPPPGGKANAACGARAVDKHTAGAAPSVEVHAGQTTFVVPARYGAGLWGLPLD